EIGPEVDGQPAPRVLLRRLPPRRRLRVELLLQVLLYGQVAGGRVDRVAAEDEEGVDLVAVEGRAQLRQVGHRPRPRRRQRVGVEDQLAGVAEVRVDGVGDGVDGGRLRRADHHQACRLDAVQVGGDDPGPAGEVALRAYGRGARDLQLPGESQ